MQPKAADLRTRLAQTLVPLAWLALALIAITATTCVAATLAPGLVPGSRQLADLNPFWGQVEVQLPAADSARAEALAATLRRAYPERAVELSTSAGEPRLSWIGSAKPATLIAELRPLAEEAGLEVGSFTMGSNLARVMERLFHDPAQLGQGMSALLPLALVVGSGVLLILGSWLRHRRAEGSESSESRLPTLRAIPLGVGLGLVLTLIIYGVSALVAWLGAPVVEQPWLLEAHAAGGRVWLAVLFGVVVLAPLGEEVFFRGYLLPAFRDAWGGFGGVVLSALAFALVHGHAPGLPAYTVYGIGLALATLQTRSLVVPIAAHMTVNAWAVAQLG